MSLLYSPSLKRSPPRTEARLGLGLSGIYVGPSTPDDDLHRLQHLYVLPVILLEFLALALTRAVLPSLLLQEYGSRVYLVMGLADFVRGSLAFVACPLFGKISDIVGRRLCLFVTVLGTCAPVCSLAFFSWDITGEPQLQYEISQVNGSYPLGLNVSDSSSMIAASESSGSDEPGVWAALWSKTDSPISDSPSHPRAFTVFIVLLSLSGIFTSTFTLVFAYISDTVRHQDERVSAYGLALATFGLSFTIGPMAGGYLARTNKQYVFIASLLMTILDLVYIYLFLPESRKVDDPAKSSVSSWVSSNQNLSWKPSETFRLVVLDPFLRKVGEVAFLYYCGLWAIISTLSVYAVKRFHLTPERLGELMSALGLCTMVAEAVLVRIAVPMLGEKKAIKLGLASFCIQCCVLGFAYEGWHLFVCVAFSLAGNLVYPSLSSLVSGSVEPDAVGEALGAINGIKALTEGIGPLIFGGLMTISEHSALPGWPYLVAAILILAAYKAADELPDPEKDDYIHELDQKKRYQGANDGILMRVLDAKDRQREDEYEGLLSDVDESDDQGELEYKDSENNSRLPATFASLLKQPFSPKRR